MSQSLDAEDAGQFKQPRISAHFTNTSTCPCYRMLYKCTIAIALNGTCRIRSCGCFQQSQSNQNSTTVGHLSSWKVAPRHKKLGKGTRKDCKPSGKVPGLLSCLLAVQKSCPIKVVDGWFPNRIGIGHQPKEKLSATLHICIKSLASCSNERLHAGFPKCY